MESKIFGVPLALILLVLAIVLPLAYGEFVILREVKVLTSEVRVNAPVVVETVKTVASPSAEKAPVKAASGSGVAK